jgi:hypothetical protein
MENEPKSAYPNQCRNSRQAVSECDSVNGSPSVTFARREGTATLRHRAYLELARAASLAAEAVGNSVEPDTSPLTGSRLLQPGTSAVKSGKPCMAADFRSLPPFGFDRIGGLLVQNHDAMVVRWVFELCAHGETPRSVADKLNRAEVWRRRRPSRWCAGDVSKLVRMRIYAGLSRPDAGEPHTATPDTRLVSDEVWRAAQ